MSDGLHLLGDDLPDDIDEAKRRGITYYDCWPLRSQLKRDHPWHDAKRIAREFEAEQETAKEFFLPQYEQLGAERDDPGALSIYERHRIVERQIAEKLHRQVGPACAKLGDQETAEELHKLAIRMFTCRTSGPFGVGPTGKPVVAWDEKCSHSKLCPDEARHEAQRLYDHYAQAIADYAKNGGRVYKLWPTLPNYPGGRLAEGQRHIFKRFYNRLIRAQKKGRNKFGIESALAVLEAPLSKNRDWNVHLNGIVLTRGWLNYKALRDAWGFDIEIREHKRFDSKGMHALFNEMIKYSLRTVPEKSQEKSRRHATEAPAFLDWTPAEVIEWYKANRRFRRTRAYGKGDGLLYGIKKPERPNMRPNRWLGRLEYRPGGKYHVFWRKHNLAAITRDMLSWNPRALDLIRGDRSTEKRSYKEARGPP